MCTESSKTIVTEQEQRCKIMCTESSKTIVTEKSRSKIMRCKTIVKEEEQ